MIRKRLGILETFLTIVIIFGITTVLFLYTKGYRLNRETTKSIDIKRTGMISTKSMPEGASVYIDGILVTATNDTVPGITPGQHELKIVKKGFIEWKKNIEVFEELVTDITAVLVSQSPRIEPLTNTGARLPSMSPSMSKLAYFSSDNEKPGIWLIPLSGSNLGLFKSNPNIILEDTRFAKYSEGSSIEWSPDEKNLLVLGQNKVYYLVDLTNNTAETTKSPEKLRETWAAKIVAKRTEILDKVEGITDNIKTLALSPKSMWAPDDKKFLYVSQVGGNLEYRVYNFEKPLPVGEKIDTVVFTTKATDPQPNINWYSDSFHLIVVDGNPEVDKKGQISIIRIDGTNKTEIYNNTLMSGNVYSAPSGDKVIIVTSYKSGGQTDLYTVSIR